MSCSCQKSGCTNNRCSCYKEGEPCSAECTCEDCENDVGNGASEPDAEISEAEEDEGDEHHLVGCMVLLVGLIVLMYIIYF